MSPTSGERLQLYRDKRDFASTPEPSGDRAAATARSGRRRFLVQRHRARRLHYDLRLEVEGTLVSWAVPKGPSLDPRARRLAVHVEDHPMDYGWFEGVIPSGYGMGDVIVWDDGWWEPDPDDGPADVLGAIGEGELKFVLHGRKLHGRFVLIHTDGDQWLVMHRKGDDTVAGWDAEDHPVSVLSGRTNDDVVNVRPARWAPANDHELTALTDLPAKGGGWEIDGRELALTNLDKVLVPASAERDRPAVTKRDLIAYLARIAPWIAPYLAGRAVNVQRFPDGIGGKRFWQKAVPDHAPEWVRRWPNPLADPDETAEYLMVDGAAALAWTGNQAAIELHPWTSPAHAPEEPSWALVDIDPGPSTAWEQTLELARLFHTALDHLELRACPKVTGQRGIQIWIPVRSGLSFDATRAFVEEVSRAVGAMVPDAVSWRWEKDRREGKARLDFTQNAINRTLVAPFSVRPAAGAPVSVPITWDELDDPELAPDRWSIHDVLDRLATAGDPLASLVGLQQELPELS